MKIAALALLGSLLVAGCHPTSESKVADGAGPVHPDVDPNLAVDQMLVAHQCSNCHAADYLRVGPPMMAVRAIFEKPTPADIDRLRQSILKGSVNKWGEAAMPPQTQVSPQDADRIIEVILGQPLPR